MSSRLMDSVTLGPQRRRRRMSKLLGELDRRDRENALRLPAPPSKPKAHRLGSALVALLLLAGAGGVIYVASHHSSPARTAAKTGGLSSDTETGSITGQQSAGIY